MPRAERQELSGPQKAAVLMLAMGEEHSTRLLNLMHDDEIKEMVECDGAARLGSRRNSGESLPEFRRKSGCRRIADRQFSRTPSGLLQKSLPRERVGQIMEEIRGPAGRTMWDKLGNVNEAVLANYLKNEYPQTVAVVLSKVRADHAARGAGPAAGKLCHGSGHAHAAHGKRAA